MRTSNAVYGPLGKVDALDRCSINIIAHFNTREIATDLRSWGKWIDERTTLAETNMRVVKPHQERVGKERQKDI